MWFVGGLAAKGTINPQEAGRVGGKKKSEEKGGVQDTCDYPKASTSTSRGRRKKKKHGKKGKIGTKKGK